MVPFGAPAERVVEVSTETFGSEPRRLRLNDREHGPTSEMTRVAPEMTLLKVCHPFLKTSIITRVATALENLS